MANAPLDPTAHVPLSEQELEMSMRKNVAAGSLSRLSTRWNDADDNVMHNGPIAWPTLRELYPLVFGEARIGEEVLIADLALGWHVVRLFRHIHNLVGLADLPADGVLARRRQIGFVAFRSASFDPTG